MSVEETYDTIRKYFESKPVKKVEVFGSISRNDHNDKSDIDLIITMERPVGLIKLAGYKLELQDIINREVDLATEPSISDDFRKLIQKDLTVLYESN